MRLSKPRGIHCSPQKWERIRRRAKKAKMSISRFGWLCCKQAAGGSSRSSVPEPEPSGHRLVLVEGVQRRLHDDVKLLSRSGRAAIRARGHAAATVYVHEVVRFRLLAKRAAPGDEQAT